MKFLATPHGNRADNDSNFQFPTADPTDVFYLFQLSSFCYQFLSTAYFVLQVHYVVFFSSGYFSS